MPIGPMEIFTQGLEEGKIAACDNCGQMVDRVILLGDDDPFRENFAICENCLRIALEKIGSERSKPDHPSTS